MVRIDVVDGETAATADLMVCRRLPDTSGFTDNLTSACTRCGHGIYFRPYAPPAVPRICSVCAIAIFLRPV